MTLDGLVKKKIGSSDFHYERNYTRSLYTEMMIEIKDFLSKNPKKPSFLDLTMGSCN